MQEQNEPGAVITPGATVSPVSQPPMPVSESLPRPVTALPQPTVPTVSPEQSQVSSAAPIAPAPNTAVYPVATQAAHAEEFANQEGLYMTWQSQESDEHTKQGSWYAVVAFVAVALTAVVFFLTERDILASTAVFLAVLGFAYLASHKPKEQQYALAQEGIYIGNKLRPYEEFKNFSEVEDIAGPTIVLIPHKRFSSPVVLRLNHDSVDAAVDTLAQFLPVEQRKPDVVDQLMRRMRL